MPASVNDLRSCDAGIRAARCIRHLSLVELCVALYFFSGSGTGGAWAVESITAEALFPGMAVLAIDGRRHTLRAGTTSPEGVKLVAADSRRAVVELDGERREISLGDRIAGAFSKPPPGEMHRVYPTADGMYVTDGTINGFSTKMLIDTGATYVALNRRDAQRFGLAYRLEGTPTRVETASGIEKAYLVELDSVRVGPIEVDEVPAVVIDGAYPATVLLGNSFLGRLDIRREGVVLELTGP